MPFLPGLSRRRRDRRMTRVSLAASSQRSSQPSRSASKGAPQHMLGEGAHFIKPGGAHFAAGLAQAAGWQSFTVSAGSFVLGFPGVSTFADSR